MIGIILVSLAVVAIWGYVVASKKVTDGEVTAYVDWGDFAWSSAWTFLTIFQFICWSWAHHRGGVFAGFLVLVLFVLIGISVYKLIIGAFRYNATLKDAFIVLYLRAAASFLSFALVGKIIGEEGRDPDGRPNVLLLILRTMFYMWLFEKLLCPLVEDNRNRKIIKADGVFAEHKSYVLGGYCALIAFIGVIIYFCNTQSSSHRVFDEAGAKKAAREFVRAFMDGNLDEVIDASCEELEDHMKEFRKICKKEDAEELFVDFTKTRFDGYCIDGACEVEICRDPRAYDWATSRDFSKGIVSICLCKENSSRITLRLLTHKHFMGWKVMNIEPGEEIGKCLLDFAENAEKLKESHSSNGSGSKRPGSVWGSSFGKCLSLVLIIGFVTRLYFKRKKAQSVPHDSRGQS